MVRAMKKATKPRMPSGRLHHGDRGTPPAKVAADNRAFIAKQPHRQGDATSIGGTLIGRLIIKGKVKDESGYFGMAEFLAAVDRYRTQRHNEDWLADAKRPLSKRAGRTRPDPTPDEVSRIMGARRERIDAIRPLGEVAEKAIEWAIIDASPDQAIGVVPHWITWGASAALVALCTTWRSR